MGDIDATLKLIGDKELTAKLTRLPPAVERKLLRPALTAGITPISKDAKRRAPKRLGLLRKAIGKKVQVKKQRATALVGVRTGMGGVENGKRVDPAKYGPLVEFGTRHAPAQACLRTAMAQGKSGALRAVGDKLREGIEREAGRA